MVLLTWILRVIETTFKRISYLFLLLGLQKESLGYYNCSVVVVKTQDNPNDKMVLNLIHTHAHEYK